MLDFVQITAAAEGFRRSRYRAILVRPVLTMKILFLGNCDFSIKTLQSLLIRNLKKDIDLEVLTFTNSKLHNFSLTNQLKVHEFTDFRKSVCDIGIVSSFGKFIPSFFIKSFKKGF
jgi:methionyl-tRNA formyltransferase